MALASTTQIRPCSFAAGEAAWLAGIWRRAWLSARGDAVDFVEPIGHWLARAQLEFKAPCEVALLEREGQMLGFMVMHPERRYVAQLFVDPHLQSQGFGKALLDHARGRMPSGWRLHVATANLRALRFYRREGLVMGSIDRHPQSGVERISLHFDPTRASPE